MSCCASSSPVTVPPWPLISNECGQSWPQCTSLARVYRRLLSVGSSAACSETVTRMGARHPITSQTPTGDRRLTPAGARRVLRQLRDKLAVHSLTSPHVLRHTAATALLEATGGDVRLVQEVLGHANVNTVQVYTKIVDARKEETYERYGKFLRTRLNA